MKIISCAVFLTVSLATSGAIASDFQSPRTSALGGAGHAGPLLNDAIYLNPSYAPFNPSYAISVNYLPFWNGAGAFSGANYNVSIQDGNADAFFQAGVGATKRNDGTILSFGASKSFIGKLGVGIGGKLVFPADGTNSKFADTIASVTFIALNWLQCSFTADNLIASDDARARGFYREFVLGTKVSILGIMFVYADPHYAMDVPNTNTPWGYEAGVEFPFFSSIFLRGGVFQNSKIDFMNQYGDGFSVGLGWMAPKISLDYSFRRIINPSLAMGHVFGATVFF